MMAAIQSPPAASAPAALRILVADDNDSLRAAVRCLLRSLGHTVDDVSNGVQAVEAAARNDFDLVFLDVQMPEMGGFEAARSLRREYAGRHRPRIVGFSGADEDRETYEAAGMDDFLAKPVGFEDLLQALEPCSARASSRRAGTTRT